MLIAGDVGGTKTTLVIYEISGDTVHPVVEATLPSAQYHSLASLVSEFLQNSGMKPEHAVFGVAGPVIGSRATITNLPWTLDEDSLTRDLALRSVRLINDLQAIAYGIPELGREDLYTLNKGERIPHGPMAVIAPGTGLGEAYITWEGSRHHAHASEGGHCDFGPRSELEIELLSCLLEQHGHVSYERICSGMGLPNIYEFLRDKDHYEEPIWLSRLISKADDRTAAIVQTALDPGISCELCTKTLELFLSILGAETGNLALKVMATGGVYLGGGIPPKILPAFADSTFMESFIRKGRLSPALERMPVHVILNPLVGLMGAASFGLSSLHEAEREGA